MDINNLMTSEDYTRNYDIQDINANKLMGILAYLGLLVLVPIFCAKESRFSMFHAEQGITLCLFGIINGGFFGLLAALIPVVGFVFGIIGGLIGLVLFLLMIIGIVNVVNGQAKELPLIGKIKLIKLH